ncbi:cytochrome C oxidase subunit IV family protein [Tropicimonas sp.]|uniref:cytochrome C oxidase subunit IV family protein n=1 Tax=Tropicimonas sp. TaxID=2067044 RepID=UPI003A8C2EDF
MTVTQAWLALVALSGASTLIAATGLTGALATVAIMCLAWVKAQIILRVYLGLRQAPEWSRGFALALGLFMIAAIILAVAAG